MALPIKKKSLVQLNGSREFFHEVKYKKQAVSMKINIANLTNRANQTFEIEN